MHPEMPVSTIKADDQAPDLSSSMGHRLQTRALNSLQCIQSLQLLETRLRVQVLHGIVERPLLTGSINFDLRVHGPLFDGLLGDASSDHRLAKTILAATLVEPVHALGHCFERRRRGMHTIVADIWLRFKAEALPILK